MTPPAESAQLVVERVEALCIHGWAVDAKRGVPQAVALLVDGAPVDAEIQRHPRADVAHALGLAADGAIGEFGFRIALPPGVWQAGGQRLRALCVQAGSAQADVSDEAPLQAHAEHILAMTVGPHRAEAARRFMAHWTAVQPSPALPKERVAALRRAGQRVLAHIESFHDGICSGWAWAEGDADETVALHDVTGLAVSASCVRAERADVQARLQSPRARLGFELEVSPAVWAPSHGDGNVRLQLWVQGAAAEVQPLVWHRDALLADLMDWHAGQVSAHGPHRAPDDQDHRLRLLMRHAHAAGLWPQMPPTLQAWLRSQGERLGVPDAVPPLTAPPAAMDERSALDRALHAALAEVNAALAPGDAAASVAAMTACVAQQPEGSELRHLLGLSLLPQACALGQYLTYRRVLDTERLRDLRHADDCWALSLLLPEVVLAGEFELASTMTGRMRTLPGWLNTECIAFAAAHLAAHWPHADRRVAAADWLDAVSRLLREVGADYWARGQDAHLTGTQVTLMRLTARLPADAADAILQRGVQAHGLVPAFWTALQARWPAQADWPPPLREAHGRWQRIAAQWAAGDDPAVALTALAELAGLSDWLDAGIWLRAALARWTGQLTPDQAISAARLASAREPSALLRLAAHPATSAATAAHLDAAWGGLSHVVAQGAGLPPARHARGVGAWLAALDGTAAAPAIDCLRDMAATAEDHGWSLTLAAWWLRRQPAGAQARQDAQADARANTDALAGTDAGADLLALAQTLGQSASAGLAAGAAPPQSLVLATRTLRAAPEGPAQDLATAWSALLAQAAPEVWARVQHTPAASLWAAMPAHRRTLVAVLSRRNRLAADLGAIASTWGGALSAQQVPWCCVVGDGDGTLAGHTLALSGSDAPQERPRLMLALLEWVLAHTDCDHLLCLPEDTHLDAPAWLARQPHVPHHYHGRPAQPSGAGDDAPAPYADGTAGIALSRWAMASMLTLLQSPQQMRRTRGIVQADQLLGQLAAGCGLPLASDDWLVRVPEQAATRPYPGLFGPGPLSGTLLTAVQESQGESMAELERQRTESALRPARLWPCDGPARMTALPHTNHLELLSPAARAAALAAATGAPVVIAVLRNERLMLPHFLAHYRGLDVRHFVLVDNGSDDGSIEFARAQADVLLYAAHTPYRHSHHGVAWQQAVLAAHGHGRWAVLADLDEFLVYPDCETRPLADWLAEQDAQGADAVRTLLIDMYPPGDLDSADFSVSSPFDAAPCFDAEPLRRWHLGSGRYSNGQTMLSGLRHRLAPGSAPNFFTAHKVAVLRHQPWMRLSDGLHDMAGMRLARGGACFAHFKYHAGFRRKVEEEVLRKQHFNDAEEYRRYLAMVAEARPRFFDPAVSARYRCSADWGTWMAPADNPHKRP